MDDKIQSAESKCLVCVDKHTKDNPILKCKNCEVKVHMLCYGIQSRRNFVCSPCIQKVKSDLVTCVLCSKKGGAMKLTTDRRFVHVICALFVKNTQIANSDTMEPINITKVRFPKIKLPCIFCEGTYGTLKCVIRNCRNYMHASCGSENGCLKEELDNKELIKFVGYCKEHVPSGQNQIKRLSSDNLKQAITLKVSTQLKAAASKQNSNWVRDKLGSEINLSHTNDQSSDDDDEVMMVDSMDDEEASVSFSAEIQKTSVIGESDGASSSMCLNSVRLSTNANIENNVQQPNPNDGIESSVVHENTSMDFNSSDLSPKNDDIETDIQLNSIVNEGIANNSFGNESASMDFNNRVLPLKNANIKNNIQQPNPNDEIKSSVVDENTSMDSNNSVLSPKNADIENDVQDTTIGHIASTPEHTCFKDKILSDLMTEKLFLDAQKKALTDLNYQLYVQLMITLPEKKHQSNEQHVSSHPIDSDHQIQTDDANTNMSATRTVVDRSDQTILTEMSESEQPEHINTNNSEEDEDALRTIPIDDKKFVYQLIDSEKSEAVQALLNNLNEPKRKLKSDFRALKEYSVMRELFKKRVAPYEDQKDRLRKFDVYLNKKIDNKVDYSRKVAAKLKAKEKPNEQC